MSVIENRIVQMQFQNRQFEKGVEESQNSLDKLKKSLNMNKEAEGFEKLDGSVKKVKMGPLGEAAEAVKERFSALEIVAITALVNITNRAIDAGGKMLKALTLDPIMQGFKEYEVQMGAIQTILANTEHQGTNLQQVNKALDELNRYADKTIYNFTEMTKNIGTFTAAGIDLDTATNSIKGIANLAAVSGSTSQQASTAMYQLSQALAAGKVSLQDWNSVVNAGMGGKVFQEALLRTSDALQTGGRKYVEEFGSFRESLTKTGWLTKEVLTETLNQMAGAYDAADLKAQGFTDSQIENILKLAKTAEDAATKVKTFSQLWDTLKEAAQSGWTESWEIMVGDFEEAKELLTDISNKVGDVIGQNAEARNKLLQGGLSSGWKQFLAAGIDDEGDMIWYIDKIAKESGPKFQQLRDESSSFTEALRKGLETGTINSKTLSDALQRMVDDYNKMDPLERKEIGVTSEQVKRMNEMNEALKNGTLSMDEFVKKMTRDSGRENIIQGFYNIAKALVSVISPIKEAFREIFPAMTGEQLYKITEGFRNFTEKLILSEEASQKVKETFKGLFSVLALIKDGVVAAFNVLKSFGSWLPGIGGTALNVSSNFGKMLSKFTDYTKNSFNLQETSKRIAESIASVPEKIKSVLPHFDKFQNGIEFLKNKVKQVFDFIGKYIGLAMDKVGEALGGLSMDNVAALASGGILTSIGLGLKKFIDTITDVAANSGDLLDGVKDILDGVRGSLEAYQQNLKAGILQKIAMSIGILAASLFLLSKIDPERAGSALTMMAAEFVGLIVALQQVEKILSGGSIKGLIKTVPFLIGFSIAILILSSALKKLSTIDWDGLMVGLVGLGGMMWMLVKATDAMSANNKRMLKGAGNLILFAAGIRILVESVKALSQLKPEELVKGLAGVGALMLELSIFMNKTDLSGMGIRNSTGIIILAGAINILAIAVQKFAEMDTNKMIQGLVGVGAVLTELSLFMNLTDTSGRMVSTSIGLTILAGAMLIFGDAVAKMGSLDVNTLGKGLAGLAGALAMCTLAVNLLPADTLPKAAGVIIMAQALRMIGDAMLSVKDMSMVEIGTSLLALAGGLAAIVIAANAMNGALAGAAATVVMATALAILTPQLLILGSMSLGNIAKGLIAIAGVFGILGGAGILLGPMVPTLLGLAGAVALLGAGTLAAGAGILALATGLTALAATGAAGIGTLVYAIKSVVELIPFIIEQVGKGIILLIKTIGDSASTIKGSLVKIIDLMLSVAKDNIPKLLDVIIKLLGGIRDKFPEIIKIGMDMLKALLTGIKENIKDVVTLFIDTILEAINGIVEQIPKIIQAGIDIIVGLIDGLAQGIETNAPRIRDALVRLFKSLVEAVLVFLGIHSPSRVFDGIGKNIIEGLIKGVGGMAKAAIDCIIKIFTDILSWIGGKMGEFLTKGAELMTNIKNGIVNKTTEVIESAKTIISNTVLAVGNKANEFLEKGKALFNSLKQGISNTVQSVKDAATNVISQVVSAVSSKVSEFAQIGRNIVDGLASGISNAAGRAADAAVSLANRARASAERALGVRSPSRVFMEIGQFTGEGFAIGLQSWGSKVESSASELGRAAIDGISSAIDNIGTVDSDPVIKPVLDLTDVDEKSKMLNNMLNSESNIGLAASVSFGINSKLSESQNGIIVNNDNVVGVIHSLKADISNLADRMSQLQVVMDSGALVGQIVNPMNEALGQQMIYDRRGI